MRQYKVLFDRDARADVRDAAHFIRGFSPAEATKWTAGLKRAAASLSSMPARCGRAREAATLGGDLRQLLFRSHRVVFRIEEDAGIVRVLYVRHTARRTVGEPEKPDDD